MFDDEAVVAKLALLLALNHVRLSDYISRPTLMCLEDHCPR